MGPGSEKGSLQAPAPRQAPFLSWQSESIPDAVCYEDSDCPPGEPVVAGNGEAWSRQGWGQKGSWNQEVYKFFLYYVHCKYLLILCGLLFQA